MLKSAENGQMPYKIKLEYSSAALPSPINIPAPVTAVGEYSGYSTSGDTITIELDNTITARSIWLQALTDGVDQEAGQTEWTVSEVRLSQATLSAGTPANVSNLAISEEDDTITLSWTAEEHASSYEIYRATGKYSNFVRYGNSTTTTFTDHVPGEKYRYYYKVSAVNAEGIESDLSDDISLEGQLFGNTMDIFSPTDDSSVIDTRTAQVAVQMTPRTSEFSSDRYTFMFKPGVYNTNRIDVGYYTSIYGLGATPLDTTLPRVEVSSWGEDSLTNFWRSIENIGIDTGSSSNEVKWAVSQAAPARRLYVNGKLHVDDIGKPASGGFLADSFVTGQAGSWSQQQYFLRNNKLTGGWYGGVWNMLFVGVDNAPSETADWANTSYEAFTVEEQAPIVREKPFLYLDSKGDYAVFVPGIRENATGVSWSEGNPGVGESISIDQFYVARAEMDTADTINGALAQGMHLLLTPGIYNVDKAIIVNNPNTVVLGIGLATIVPTNGNDAMQLADVEGLTIAGILFDAGEAGSEHLLQVGPESSTADHSANPTLLADVFTRVGGAVDGKAEITVEINSNHVIGDHFWLWRADHGLAAGSTGWLKNVSKNGLVVNGDDVTVYGLFVEHFQEYQTIWNGENGRTYFYQSEIPYDPPYQSDYMSHDGTVKGYSSYKVSDHVKSHYAVALGIYDVFVHNIEWVELENAIEVPDGTKIKHAAIVSLGANGGTNHIINGIGGSVSNGEAKKVGINSYYVERKPTPPTDGSTSPGNGTEHGIVNEAGAAIVFVNGIHENIGKKRTENVNGTEITTLAFDEETLATRLESEEVGSVQIKVLFTNDSEISALELSAKLLEQINKQRANLEFQTGKAAISLSAQQLTSEEMLKSFGETAALEDIKIRIEIAEPSAEMIRIASEAASKGSFKLLVQPVSFRFTAEYEGRTVEISNFNHYVERSIAIPKDIDPSTLSTGIVIDPDGMVRHIPTRVETKDGNYYAVMNSLTNSVYAIISHNAIFSDMTNHWAKETIENLGERLIVYGDGNHFNPTQTITRAEFASIIVRALGLKGGNDSNVFTDVKASDWYSKAVLTAYEYGLINGFEDGSFRPSEELSREQAAVIIDKAMSITKLHNKLPELSLEHLLQSYDDADAISMWARESFGKGMQAEIIQGRNRTLLAPKDNITRAEAAILIERLLKKSELI